MRILEKYSVGFSLFNDLFKNGLGMSITYKFKN